MTEKPFLPPSVASFAKLGPLERLLVLLDLEPIDRDLFRGFHPPDRKRRLFGGQIIAQALVAAMRTTPDDRLPHSLHAYFLRPGDPWSLRSSRLSEFATAKVLILAALR